MKFLFTLWLSFTWIIFPAHGALTKPTYKTLDPALMTAPGVTKLKTCYAAFGGASATITSPTNCSTATCLEVYDSCGTFSPPAFSSTGLYTSATFASGTWANNAYIDCECKSFDVTTANGSDCNWYWTTGNNAGWATTSAGGYVGNIQATSQTGTAANKYVTIKCEAPSP